MKDDGKYKPVYIYVDDLLVDVLSLGCSPSLIRVCFPFARYWVPTRFVKMRKQMAWQ